MTELGDQISTERLVALTQELIGIPSVNPFGDAPMPGVRESEIAERYAALLESVGCEVIIDGPEPDRPNVVGVLRGATPGPTVLLAGHIDTVGVNGYAMPFEPRIENGRIHGRGSCDMKAALAAFIEVARIINEATVPFAGTLMVAGIADEEDRMAGSLHWAAHGPPPGMPTPDVAIVGEPTSLAVCPAHKGQYGTYMRTFGTAVHSSLRSQGVNAIEKMSDLIGAFADYNDELAVRPHHELCGHASFSIGVISGGEVMSTVPDFCQIEADRRMIPGETPEQVVVEYRARLEALAATDPDFRYELDGPTMEGGILDTPTDHPVVVATTDAVVAVTGSPATVSAFTGATDAPNFGCPAVICGPGSLAQAHSLDEYVDIDEITAAAKIYLGASLALLR
jgi:acetylornithine deacetylase/succinyl-diaminopimelate desuccinylase-like protein